MSARADAAYVAFLNSPVLFYDALGLVAWRKKECVGCNASAASVTAGVIHGGDPWTCKFFDSSWWSGNFEQFNHWCRPDTLYSSVCNTKTYIEMKMKNRRCCCKSERFNIVCKVRYHARVLAQDQLEAVIKVKFLGTYDTLASAYRPSPTEAPGAGYAEEINPAPKAYTAASVRVPCKEEKVVIKLSPRVIMHGKPGFIKEKGSVYCSAVCVE